MTITLAEFMVLMDILVGSLGVADGGTIWKFNRETRQKLANALLDRAGNASVNIQAEGPEKKETT